jgi:pyruvate,water dikinase
MDNLVSLEEKISVKIIPEMISEAEARDKIILEELDDNELIEEINHRASRLKYWHKVYWEEFIPMAHGARLFGQIYNDHVKPDDPYEFTVLLSGTDMLSMRRNQRIMEISKKIEDNPELTNKITDLDNTEKSNENLLSELYGLFGKYNMNIEEMISVLKELSQGKGKTQKKTDVQLEKYYKSFSEEEREFAEQALRIGRKSWKLRDDDNIVLGSFERLLTSSLTEARERLIKIGIKPVEELLDDEIILSLSTGKKVKTAIEKREQKKSTLIPRQLVGQPAGPGIATGKARVIHGDKDLVNFQKGEILVSDAIDPNMTFIVPLASGIIERRGGMLIHGAIIAREYELPCVTGIPDATEVIKTGDIVTVDGYLGIVTINRKN